MLKIGTPYIKGFNMISILFELSDPHGRYKQYQNLDLSDDIRNKQSHNKFIRSRGRNIGRLTKSIDKQQMKGSIRERPRFGMLKKLKYYGNKLNIPGTKQHTLARYSGRKTRYNVPNMQRGDRRNIAWDAIDGVF